MILVGGSKRGRRKFIHGILEERRSAGGRVPFRRLEEEMESFIHGFLKEEGVESWHPLGEEEM